VEIRQQLDVISRNADELSVAKYYPDPNRTAVGLQAKVRDGVLGLQPRLNGITNPNPTETRYF